MSVPLRVFLCSVLIIILVGCGPARQSGASADTYFSPVDPPSSRYVIDARVDSDKALLEGRETISLKNTCSNPIGVLAFDWDYRIVVAARSFAQGREAVSAGGRTFRSREEAFVRPPAASRSIPARKST